MNRPTFKIACCAPLLLGMTACNQSYVKNCPVIGANPSTNLYNLSYELVIPAECPIPLANPGTESKYAAARIWDYNGSDMEFAKVEVTNSAGKRVAHQVFPFVVSTNVGYAEPRAEYIAATGAQTFTDHDIATFSAFSIASGKSANGKTKLTYQQTNLSARLTGEPIPPPQTSQTWTAPVSGGYPAFTYNWYRNGLHVGTGQSYSATVDTADFDLRVEVTDQTWSTVAAVMAVDVGGVEASFTGPSVVREGIGATWYAAGRGGTGSYTYVWYLDDYPVGNGATFEAVLDAGSHLLRLQAKDAAGEVGTLTRPVRADAVCANGARIC